MLQAYELLCAEQLAVARAGSGTRVARAAPIGLPTIGQEAAASVSRYAWRLRSLPPITLVGAYMGGRPTYNLAYGQPLFAPALFTAWRRKLAAAALRAGSTHSVAGGYLPLRQALAEYLARRRGIVCDATDILIVGGTQQALTMVERVVLNPGDHVIVEDPHCQAAKQSLLAHGARIISGRTDEQGLVIQELPQHSIRLVLVTPAHQFPSGVVMSLDRRLDLLKWATQTGSWILEDDYDAEFSLNDGSLPTLTSMDRAGRVIYVGSFSKTLFPSLRLGYIVCPKALRGDLYKTKLLDDLGSPAIEQAALACFIQSGQYEKHLRKFAMELANRRQIAIDALQRLAGSDIEIGPHHSGTHFVVWLRHIGINELAGIIDHARTLGLGLHPVNPYYILKPHRPGLLVGFAGLSVSELKTAIELFAQCLKHKKSGHSDGDFRDRIEEVELNAT